MIIINNLSNKKKTNNFLFADLNLNFVETQISTNRRNNDIVAGNDLVIDVDEQAIKNSLRNILTQKRYLVPGFGADLRNYIGGPLSEINAKLIGREIEKQITNHEPRVKLENIYIAPDYDNFMYAIVMIVKLPNITRDNTVLNSIFTNDGEFYFLDK